jgi:hypothetical protein
MVFLWRSKNLRSLFFICLNSDSVLLVYFLDLYFDHIPLHLKFWFVDLLRLLDNRDHAISETLMGFTLADRLRRRGNRGLLGLFLLGRGSRSRLGHNYLLEVRVNLYLSPKKRLDFLLN